MSQSVSLNSRKFVTVNVSMMAILAAVGIALSAFNPFVYLPPILSAIINPFVHFINVIAGVLLGPWYALGTALIVAVIRYATGLGTILAFPGGLCGAFIVGLVREILLKKKPKQVHFAAFTEPLGTVFIGGTIAGFIRILPFWSFWLIFAIASVIGCILGWMMLKVLDRAGLSATFLPAASKVACETPVLNDRPIEEKPAPH